MSKIHSIQTYNIQITDVFFFDNNVWMYLLCPIGNYGIKKQSAYSKFLTQIRQKKCPIHVSSLVMSEFTNACLRLQFNILKDQKKLNDQADYKKDFVGTHFFKESLKEIKGYMDSMMKIATQNGDDFAALNMKEELFHNFGEMDFNDSYYLAIACPKRKKWKIVTDDSDFLKSTIVSDCDIITNLSLS